MIGSKTAAIVLDLLEAETTKVDRAEGALLQEEEQAKQTERPEEGRKAQEAMNRHGFLAVDQGTDGRRSSAWRRQAWLEPLVKLHGVTPSRRSLGHCCHREKRTGVGVKRVQALPL